MKLQTVRHTQHVYNCMYISEEVIYLRDIKGTLIALGGVARYLNHERVLI